MKRNDYTILSNYDIIELANKLKINDLVFVGSQDLLNTIPKKMRKNKFYIINFDNESGAGNHWVCLSTHMSKDRDPFYADSFGQPPPIKVHTFVSNLKPKQLNYWDKQLQSLNSTICGWYCVLVCDMMNQYYMKGLGFNDFINDFKKMGWNYDRQEKNNYKIVDKYFSKRI